MPDRDSFDPADYVGASYEDARARAEAAGWQVRKMVPNGVYTLEFRPDRLNLLVDPDHDETVADASLG